MKKDKKLKIAVIAAAVAIAGTVTVYAAYDSSKDPLVSLSYLSDIFKPAVKEELYDKLANDLEYTMKTDFKSQLSEELGALIDEKSDEIRSELEKSYSETLDALRSKLDALSNEYEVVVLEAGQRLTADAACDIVLITGGGTVRCADTESGIIDCTDGIILYDGQSIPTCHKLLVPDNGDGRGITATARTELLVKGGYTVG